MLGQGQRPNSVDEAIQTTVGLILVALPQSMGNSTIQEGLETVLRETTEELDQPHQKLATPPIHEAQL